MASGSKILALDMDDVLVHISTPWILKALQRPTLQTTLQRLLPPSLDKLMEVVLTRTYPHIQEWLTNDLSFPTHLLGELNLAYRGDPTFYDDLHPTKLAESIKTAMEVPGWIGHIHVVTHNFDHQDPCVESKTRWIKNQFGTNNVTIHHLTPDQRKSDVLHAHCPKPTVFADDSLKNVIDVLVNRNVQPDEILIPEMGHNIMDDSTRYLAVLRQIQISYYQNIL